MLALAGCAAPAAGTGGMVEPGNLPPLDAGAATAPPEQLAYDILQAIDMRARLRTAAQMYGLAPELGASIYFRWLDGTMHELRGLDRQQIDQLLRHAEANLTFYQDAAKGRGQFPIAGAWRATVQHGCGELWGDGASITFNQTGAFVQTSTRAPRKIRFPDAAAMRFKVRVRREGMVSWGSRGFSI
jgi:hypothetical protein